MSLVVKGRVLRRRIGLTILVAACVAVLLVEVSVLVVGVSYHRVHRFSFTATDHDPGDQTFVLLGLDAPTRVALTTAGVAAPHGTQRADVVIVVRVQGGKATAIVLPRDTLIPEGRYVDRLTTTWLRGPDAFAAGLCELGIPVDHIVTIDFAGLVGLVNAAGGVTVTTDAPLRDRKAHLYLPTPGQQRLGGQQSLGWIRSRHARQLINGRWVRSPKLDTLRQTHAAGVLEQVGHSLDRAPWRIPAAAAALGPATQADRGLGIRDAMTLGRALRTMPTPTPISATVSNTAVPVATLTPAGRRQIAAFVDGDVCRIGR
jgi:polyisoprenyl-teichoic acid--peptidoglycan teichoic acid transferase